MQTTLENKKKVATDFSRNAFKRKNKVEEGKASSLGVKKENECTNLKAHKMMRGRVEQFAIPIVVKVVPLMVQVIKQTTVVPQMTSPQER